MIEQGVGRIGSLVRIVTLAGILLLTAGIGLPPWANRDPSVSEGLTALVTCVLPGTAAVPPSTPVSASPAMSPGCEDPTPYRPNATWITC